MNLRFFFILLGVLFLGIIGLFSWSTYGYYSAIHQDDPTNPLLRVEQGEAKIIRGDIAIELIERETYILENKDIVETAAESLATVTWPDRSITRLGATTRIIIQKMYVSQDYSRIEISYDMKKGKVWNTIVRLLVGDSYFEVGLPKEEIVAGVRGSVFEINLEKDYIHAVEHSTHLRNGSGEEALLFPGEAVKSDNIFTRIAVELLDTTWQEWNSLQDATYRSLRSLETETRMRILAGVDGLAYIGDITGDFLSEIQGFEAIEVSRSLLGKSGSSLETWNERVLLEYYQRFAGLSSPLYRDQIRESILTKIQTIEDTNPLEILLENAGIWESIDSGEILPSTQKILGTIGSSNLSLDRIKDIRATLDPETLGKSLSGSIKNWLSRGMLPSE